MRILGAPLMHHTFSPRSSVTVRAVRGCEAETMRDERDKQVRDLAVTGVGLMKRYKSRERLGQDEVRVGGERRRLATIGYRRRFSAYV